MCDSGAQSCCELMMLSLADASARQGLGLASLGPGSLGRAEAWSRRPACRICLESYPPLPYRQRMKRPAANAPRRRMRAAKARAGILRPSTFLPAPDAPPLMGTLDADDGGVAREVAPTAADTTASAPPSGCFILLRPQGHFGRLGGFVVIANHAGPSASPWGTEPPTEGGSRCCGSPIAKGPSAPTSSLLGPWTGP